jgi:hypothetical protein
VDAGKGICDGNARKQEKGVAVLYHPLLKYRSELLDLYASALAGGATQLVQDDVEILMRSGTQRQGGAES